jgi:hypothetical protein
MAYTNRDKKPDYGLDAPGVIRLASAFFDVSNPVVLNPSL